MRRRERNKLVTLASDRALKKEIEALGVRWVTGCDDTMWVQGAVDTNDGEMNQKTYSAYVMHAMTGYKAVFEFLRKKTNETGVKKWFVLNKRKGEIYTVEFSMNGVKLEVVATKANRFTDWVLIGEKPKHIDLFLINYDEATRKK
jgi:hypothetical protein